jgi:hypothetical protein
MNDADRYKLLHGPYRMPRCKLGGCLFCQARGWVVVKRISTGPIPWPQTIVKHSRTFILYGDLAGDPCDPLRATGSRSSGGG